MLRLLNDIEQFYLNRGSAGHLRRQECFIRQLPHTAGHHLLMWIPGLQGLSGGHFGMLALAMTGRGMTFESLVSVVYGVRRFCQYFRKWCLVKPCDQNIKLTIQLTQEMMRLADQGDVDREDTGCGVLYGVLRDSAFKIRQLAEMEKSRHQAKGWWQEACPPSGPGHGPGESEK